MTRDPYWNHNTRYHPWLLAKAPTSARTALDVGCGDGLLARKLATGGREVVGIDADSGALEQASGANGVRFEQADFREFPGTFDYVTAVATLHHVPLVEGLTALRRLVAPGGTLAVVGLWKMTPLRDAHYFPMLPLIWAIDHFPPRPSGPDVPLRDPVDTLDDIRKSAAAILPGARIRRRLMWRYTLLWQRPA
ncbi:class I SAM-dependent methyltransferase [Nocardia bhagyanarayanae]|uniref:Methyltransferase family protein n=1 Tax=Nocardia bhagyanarayanae TaxID=1215925 RepID=A0A543FGW0_9NOCA|nr:class I SAM-dependent methyltransferase [Nocardia bhagyanarayanae]TQM33085.1 methyltransferase family protein [Nocardia bhagyanarayanae]